ncbi:TonB-dependent receptor [Zhongshania aliphaticivorans]|uniref:TonB-dependent receptor n=1 Tax=Zhongshania aliphaticivorans TaxID=1470434 RepID=UPI0012E6E19E|nr:TonB-dependent siderophore receptor [Zhongshania aliphaticivorans]CAA0119473.1 Ferripyoverdine receptor [Zhongshania aliphaticivorans]
MKLFILTPVIAVVSTQFSFVMADEVPASDQQKVTEHMLVTGIQDGKNLALDESSGTGSRLDISLRDLPASVSVISQNMIQQYGARTAMEAVETAVGMTGGTGVGSIPGYSTRGFSSNDITILRDGVRQNTNSQSARPLDSFMFEQVEVLKGPASLLHGEGAVGGAINYVSKMPTQAFSGEALMSAGVWDNYRTAIGVGGPTAVKNLYYRADISHNESGGYVHGSEEVYDAAGGSLLWRANDAARFTVSASYFEDDVKSYYGTPVVYDTVINIDGEQEIRPANTSTDRLVNPRIAKGTRRENYNNLDNFAQAENAYGRFISEISLSDHWEVRNELYLATQKLDWRNTEKTVWNPQTNMVDRSSFFLIYRDDTQIGNRLDFRWKGNLFGRENQFVIGTLYDLNNQNRNSGQSYPNSPDPSSVSLHNIDRGYGPDAEAERTAKIITQNTAVYFENVLDFSDQLKLIGGLRYDAIDVERKSYTGADKYNKTYYPVTGRVGAVYSLMPELNIYASYSRAAQPVSQLVSLDASKDEFSLQKGEQIEIGTKASLLNDSLDITIALYDIEKNDILTSDVIDGIRISSQIGAQVSQGIELAASSRLPNDWRVDANVAWNWKAEFDEFNENLGTEVISRTGNTPTNVPEWVAALYVNKVLGNWKFNSGVRHVGEREANNNNGIQLASYTTVDASVAYQWQQYTFTLRGRNLSDETYASWASGGGLTQRLADPRSAELGVHYRFAE